MDMSIKQSVVVLLKSYDPPKWQAQQDSPNGSIVALLSWG